MSHRHPLGATLLLWWLSAIGCEGSEAEPIQAGGDALDGGADVDTLDVSVSFAPGSFDDLHANILQPRCAGEPGLCHNGQFPPNLATPAVAYWELVRSLAIERPERLRVAPGDPAASLLVDKLRNRDVASQMPLGAEPLTDAELAAIEGWIRGGALRRPDAAPPEELNLPPAAPEIAVYDDAGNWLDMAGPALVGVGDTVVVRHSVQDFEHPNEATLPFASCSLEREDGFSVAIENNDDGTPSTDATTTFDAAGPMGITDALNYSVSWTVTDPVLLVNEAGATREEPASGLRFDINCFYTDDFNGLGPGGQISVGYLRFVTEPGRIEVQ